MKRGLLRYGPLPWLLPLVGVLALASLAIGSTAMPVLEGLWQWLRGEHSLAAIVIGEIRLPRTLLALAAGACLGLAGAALQGLLRNPLADPSLTGASQGAALGAAAVFYFGLFPALGGFATALGGLAGALAALGLLLWLAGAVLAWQAWHRAGALARERARPAMLALAVTVFPLNTHLAFYSTFWGGLTLLLAALYAGALLAEEPAGAG